MPQLPDEPLIDTPEGLAELTEHLKGCGRFAFDTEFVSEDTFEPVLCLVQVATRDRLVVVDPIAVGDVRPFWEVVVDPAVEVVMHAAGEDLRICRFQTGLVPPRLFDVQIAAGLVGFGYPLSLGNLVQQALGISLVGGETRTDWRRRPLSHAQLRYALDDVRHLLDLADDIQADLQRRGRAAWATAEMEGFLAGVRGRDDEERWRRLPGLHQLNRRGLEVARRLAEWRLEMARRSNRPLRQVVRDDIIVAIAKRQPTSRHDLEALRDFNRPALMRKSEEILNLVASARAVPAEHLPEHGERHEEGPGMTMLVNLLAAGLSHCCAQEKVAVGLVGTTSDLKDLVRWRAEGQPEERAPDLARGWRALVCGRTLLDLLDGHLALRVVDPAAEVPVALEKLDHPPRRTQPTPPATTD
jgi:ribonuclease D